MEITVLGSGTSQGVPVIACDCHVCKSNDERDKRLRCSVLVSLNGKNYVIDAGPDFRQQLLRAEVTALDGILLTHEHKDHIAGLDDVRAFNYQDNRPMDIYCNEAVEQALKREFHYVFAEKKYPGIPAFELKRIDKHPFVLKNEQEVIPVEVLHYEMPVLGFRFGNFAYITDAKTVSEHEINKLMGVEVLIVNALRIEPHLSHFNLQEALEFIAKIQPKKAYLTHISHMFGTHLEIERLLPPNVAVAYDGMRLTIE